MTTSTATKHPKKRKTREQVLNETLPQFEQFIENREAYIKALETTIQALKQENQKYNKNNLAIRSSIDEMVAMQQLSNIISTAVEPEIILSTLIDLTKQVIPVLECSILLFGEGGTELLPLSDKISERLKSEVQQQLEAGILDWVFAEKKTIIIPDLEYLDTNGTGKNFVVVPLMLRNRPMGVYVVHTTKPQQEFSNQDIQLLTVLAIQAAAGVENWNTYRKLAQANSELISSQAQMVQAAKLAAIGELAAGILHEIKNPVQVLMMYVDLVKRGKQLPNWVDMFTAQVKRLSEITRRLTNFSRKVSEDLKQDPIDINKAVSDIVDMVLHQFRNDKIEIELQLSDPMPPTVGNVNLLQQVFLNLFINARDAMPNGGKCTVITAAQDSTVVIRFSDSGTGIESELLSKIFDPFFTTKEEGKGTGLGLSICKKIVAQHGGEILVESSVGVGTTFSIVLPLRRPTP